MDWVSFQFFSFILVSLLANSFSNELGSSCSKDRHCKVDNSQCSSGVCTCKHYYAPFGTTKCLESKLLGQDCLMSKQCSLRVANSTCYDGLCHCSQGFLQFRKHTCLGPAKPGDVCYSDEHCQLYSKNTHCRFLIRKLFGKCICNTEGNCESNEFVKPPAAVTDIYLPDGNKTENAATTTNHSESNNYGEMPEKGNENASEEQPEKIFVDPFQHQKVHLHDMPSQMGTTEKSDTDFITTTLSRNQMEDEVTETPITEANILESEGVTPTKILDTSANSTDISKYRVETSDKKDESVNWNDVTPVSLGYPCHLDLECQKRDNHSRCINGICDCVVKTNGINSCGRYNRACGPETFQCRESGTCISWFFVCDGRNDCPDKSDEECRGPKCPQSSFRCKESGTCVSLAAVCDGVKNCPNGEDESFCSPSKRNSTQGCPSHTFQCANGECLPKYEFCNAIPKCSDGSDESPFLCSSQHLGKKAGSKKKKENCPFECGNGRCRSTAIVCSGRDGCGDNSDETFCSVCSCPAVPTDI